jgi:hypothetical protein
MILTDTDLSSRKEGNTQKLFFLEYSRAAGENGLK